MSRRLSRIRLVGSSPACAVTLKEEHKQRAQGRQTNRRGLGYTLNRLHNSSESFPLVSFLQLLLIECLYNLVLACGQIMTFGCGYDYTCI